MLRHPGWIPLLMSAALTGCVGVNPVGMAFTGSTGGYSKSDFDAMFPAKDQSGLASHRPDFTRELAVRTKPGSKVTIFDDSRRSFTGTLVRADANQVELLDCLSREVVPGPGDTQQQQTSYVRFRSLAMRSLTHLTILSSPAKAFISPNPSDGRDVSIAAVVLMDGRIQPCGTSPEQTVADDLAGTPLGSQVLLVDNAGRQSEGILLNAGPDRLELMTCIEFETVPGPGGVEQCQTNLVPFRTVERSRLTSFTIVAPPSPEFAVPEIGQNCAAYCFEEFVSADGSRYRWEKPLEREIPRKGFVFVDETVALASSDPLIFRDGVRR
jgi:hypothetical protein